jgi:hypothetical protein
MLWELWLSEGRVVHWAEGEATLPRRGDPGYALVNEGGSELLWPGQRPTNPLPMPRSAADQVGIDQGFPGLRDDGRMGRPPLKNDLNEEVAGDQRSQPATQPPR